MKASFVKSRDNAFNIKTFYFKPERSLNFTAGQFAEWTLKHPNPDDRGIKRWFTISSSPTEELISLTTKFDIKPSTYKKALADLRSGDEINVSEPMGDFVLPKIMQTPLLFVAGGIGITPFHSMLTWIKDTGETRRIKLLYAVENEDEIIFHEQITKSGIESSITVKNPTPAWGGERGSLSAELILGLEKPSDDTLVYVSGPEPMVEKIHKELMANGLGKRQFIGDFFPNYSEF